MQVGQKEFVKTKYSALDGKTTVGFGHEDFMVKANVSGVQFQGTFTLEDDVELQNFAKLLAEAWVEHKRMLAAVTKKLSSSNPAEQ